MSRDVPGGGLGPQLPLALRYPPDQRFESFIAPPDGALAALSWLAAGTGADWVYLAGASRTGKTHLAIALGVEATKQKRRVLFTRAADLVRQLLEARDARAARKAAEAHALSSYDEVSAAYRRLLASEKKTAGRKS